MIYGNEEPLYHVICFSFQVQIRCWNNRDELKKKINEFIKYIIYYCASIYYDWLRDISSATLHEW